MKRRVNVSAGVGAQAQNGKIGSVRGADSLDPTKPEPWVPPVNRRSMAQGGRNINPFSHEKIILGKIIPNCFALLASLALLASVAFSKLGV